MIEVMNLKRQVASRIGDVRIDRRSKWGNPYHINKQHDREAVIEQYREYIEGKPDLLDDLRSLEPHRLFCWCAPQPCHGDVLKELLEAE